jgi:hypothetical protein
MINEFNLGKHFGKFMVVVVVKMIYRDYLYLYLFPFIQLTYYNVIWPVATFQNVPFIFQFE